MNRDFKGVWIPREVYLDNRLNALDKIILVEIDSLDNGEEGCFASNKYLADFCQCSQTKVSNSISKLIKCGYIETVGFDGRTRNLKSRLTKFNNQPYKICEADSQILQHNNIDNNIDNNIIKEKKKKEKFKPPTIDEVRAYCNERNNGIDPESFIDFYASKGWKVGNQSMKDWKACVRTWERRNKKPVIKNESFGDFPQRTIDNDAMERMLLSGRY